MRLSVVQIKGSISGRRAARTVSKFVMNNNFYSFRTLNSFKRYGNCKKNLKKAIAKERFIQYVVCVSANHGTYIVCGLFLAIAYFFPVISVGCFSKKSVLELTRIMKTNVEME